VTLYLVRHGKAGDRNDWPGDDLLRPLSRRGQRQAEGLVALLEGFQIDRILSSSYVRCMESVVQLAGVRLLPIEPVEALAEGGAIDDAVTLVRKHAHEGVVMSTHGDIMQMLLEHFAARGLDLGPTPEYPKGCVWIVEFQAGGEPVSARYLPPPPD
jgi:8-oxo-dGTP diphosphatase